MHFLGPMVEERLKMYEASGEDKSDTPVMCSDLPTSGRWLMA
jgi:hypothetical protein